VITFARMVLEVFECALVANVALQPDASAKTVHVSKHCDMLS